MIYCVIPQALSDELYDKMVAYYKDDPNVTVIIDRREGPDRRRGAERPSTRSSASCATGATGACRGHLPADVLGGLTVKVVVHVDGGARGNPGPGGGRQRS